MDEQDREIAIGAGSREVAQLLRDQNHSSGRPRPTHGTSGDQLQYIADLINELQSMAERSGCSTLARLLNLAESEARLQARRG